MLISNIFCRRTSVPVLGFEIVLKENACNNAAVTKIYFLHIISLTVQQKQIYFFRLILTIYAALALYICN